VENRHSWFKLQQNHHEDFYFNDHGEAGAGPILGDTVLPPSHPSSANVGLRGVLSPAGIKSRGDGELPSGERESCIVCGILCRGFEREMECESDSGVESNVVSDGRDFWVKLGCDRVCMR